jgi:hypothetical protein
MQIKVGQKYKSNDTIWLVTETYISRKLNEPHIRELYKQNYSDFFNYFITFKNIDNDVIIRDAFDSENINTYMKKFKKRFKLIN